MAALESVRNYTLTIQPEEGAAVEAGVPYRVIVTPEDESIFSGANLAYELPAGASYHDALLVAEALNGVNARLVTLPR